MIGIKVLILLIVVIVNILLVFTIMNQDERNDELKKENQALRTELLPYKKEQEKQELKQEIKELLKEIDKENK